MSRYDLLIESPNYQDFVVTKHVDVDIYSEGGGSYSYDEDTQTFTFGGGTYSKETVSVPVYELGDQYESYFDTINIIFNTNEVNDNNIKAFVSSITTMAHMTVTYSTDGNYTFQGNVRELAMGNQNETGYFGNDTVKYRGTKPIVVKEIISGSRSGKSIRFRVKAKMDVEDDISIFYITILPSGLIFSGEFND